jgi:hypothetical protein
MAGVRMKAAALTLAAALAFTVGAWPLALAFAIVASEAT